MSTSETSGLVTDLAGLRGLVGKHAGYTEWQVMDQERVNKFADATDDHQYIHVDVERAKASPFGGTIAHGYPDSVAGGADHRQLVPVTRCHDRHQLRAGPGPVPGAAARSGRSGAAAWRSWR